MHKFIDTVVMDLTQETAEEFSSLPASTGDRDRDTPKGRRHIEWLKGLVEDGIFHTPKWATARLDGKLYRVNGGHSSMMLAELNGEFPKGLSVSVDRFSCDTPFDLADLFMQFDTRNSIRTFTDKVNAHKAACPNLADVNPTYVGRAIYGIAWSRSWSEGAPAKLTGDERFVLIDENQDFILWAKKYMGAKKMSGVPKVASMFETFELYPFAATHFWNEVVMEDHPNNKHPTRKISEYFKALLMAGSGKNKNNLMTTYVKIVHAWNAAVRGKTTDMKCYSRAPVPMFLKPTVRPYIDADEFI